MTKLKYLPKVVLVFLLATTPFLSIASEPYTPVDDDEILVKLPTEVFARRIGITKLRERLSMDADNPELAATVARHYLKLGKSEGDPRFFGYAKATILPWWDKPTSSPDILRVRAKLKETNHNYREALADLEAVLQVTPKDTQTLVEISNINRVLGDYEAAWKAADRIEELDESLPAVVAQVPLLAMTGKAEQAYDLLSANFEKASEELPGIIPWTHTMLAEIARALGREAIAEKHFLDGMQVAPDNSYLQRSYADFLLDQERGEEALAILETSLKDNGILLRSAIAAKHASTTNLKNASLAKEWSEQLRNRFYETRLRGDLPHGRYESRFEIEFGNDPKHAIDLALANWDRQKEIRDTRNVLEAALAAKSPDSVQQILLFLKESGTQDVALEKLIQQLGGE